MNHIERMLDPAGFLRIHRSVLVNLRRITELHRDPDGAGSVLLQSGIRLRVARGRWEALETALGLIRL
jgi:two-component system LytT family response regulator